MADETLVTIVVISVVLLGVLIGEFFWLRNRRLKKRMGTGGPVKKRSLQDDAHNALITGRAIAKTLDRGGTPMTAVKSQLDKAQVAYDRGNYRVAIDMVETAKDSMKATRLAGEKNGDLAKLDSSPTPPAEDEMLTKEIIAKKMPENFIQAKFSLNLARDHLEKCRVGAMDTEAAALVLQDAEKAFEEKDYTTALKLAVACKNLLATEDGGLETIPPDEEVIEITEEQLKNRCTGCGEFLVEGDGFCRKCGAKIPKAAECEKCGKAADIEDKFCRGCGTELPS
ncbi:MAG: zinc ribbon domain-containing protein [Thermoplasmata archaeon]